MPDASPAAIGRRIAEYRNKLGLSQPALARQVYAHRNTVYKIENGLQSPSFDLIILLSHALQVSLNQLAYGERATVRRQ